MKLPTDIPDDQHADLQGDEVIQLTREDDARIQVAMIRTHSYLLAQRFGREFTFNEAAAHWVASGYAAAYRRHYQIRKD